MKIQALDKLTNSLYEGNSGISLDVKLEPENLSFFKKYFGRIEGYIKRVACIGLVTAVLAGGMKAMAATYHVNPTKTIQSTIDNVVDETIITNNRSSHTNSQSNIQYPSIQAAIDATVDGDTIILARGIFTGYGNRDIDFSGKAITVRSIDPNDPNIVATTIIDCQGSETEPHRGFYFQSGEDANSILAGITIINGYASGSWPANRGGAIYCNSSPTLLKCTFSSNSAGYGGGMYNDSFSSTTLTMCIFNSNLASDRGGGIYNNDDSYTRLTNCIFSNNSANNGGGIYNDEYSSPVLVNCTLSDNLARKGGGMSGDESNPILINCIFSNNSASKGGGLSNDNWNSPILTNCVFSGNSASYGNGMSNDDGSHPILTNCILWNGGNEIWNDESTITITYSNIQGGWPGVGNIDADPNFADAPNNDYHLKSQAGRYDPNTKTWVLDDVTSPCIDAGDPLSPIMYEPFPNGGRINMGAYGGTPYASKSYFNKPPCKTIVAGDINGDCKINFEDFAIMAYHWLEDYNEYDGGE